MTDDADFLETPAAEFAAPLFAHADDDAHADDVIAALRRGLGDRYQVEREIGRGGMATVYLARDVKHGRPVALKVLQPDLTSALGADRFAREIQTIAGLRHPHILPLHDSGEVDGHLYYVMPFIDGESLRGRLTREGQLPLADTLGIAVEIADALQYAHDQGVIHRDIKPENILLDGKHAIVADFGISHASASSQTRLTATGLALGTPAYMSPEQVAGEASIDGRSDIYSLGCVIYEMLTGRTPFDGLTAQAMLARRLTEQPPSVREARPDAPVEVDALIARAMAPTPTSRFATAADLVNALRRAQLATPATPLERLATRTTRFVRRKTVVVAVVLVALVAGAGASIMRVRSAVAPSAAAIAVLPLNPVAPDSALSRLGRELAITLSANLDGVDGIHTADPLTVLAHVPTSALPPSQGDVVALARRLGASSALSGTLLRLGDRVRVDLTLHPANGGEPIAKVSVTAPAEDIAALTDSATWALLHEIWRRGGPSTPSLAAVTTRSIPAMRAFLDGERQIVEGRWRTAPEAFERAFTEDSTFWLAYWRYAFARDYWNAGVDPAIRAKYVQHRAQLPERDRLLIEAGMTDSLSVRYERTKAVAARFPNYWPAWWMLSENLAHDAPLTGTSTRDLRAALERTLSLNPRMTSAWQHLFWEAMWERDTLLSQRILQELTRLRYDSVSRGETGLDELAHFRYLDALARARGGPPDSSLAEPGIRLFASMTGPIDPYGFGLMATQYGFPREQVSFSRRVIARGASPQMVTAHLLAIAVGQAARGSWDSSVVALDQFVTRVSDPGAALYRYRVEVIGTWLGAITPDSAARRRRAAVSDSARLAPATRAEIAWLDGLLAFARQDSSALASARRALATTDSVTSPMLGRSLAAFALALAGDRGRAADSLEALEGERVERGWSRYGSDTHPFLTAIDRLAAGRWLRERGDAARAARLLTWHDAVMVPQRETRQANAMVQGLAYLELARATAALGHDDLAREYYQRFLWRYDAPPAAHRHLVDEARRALERWRSEPARP